MCDLVTLIQVLHVILCNDEPWCVKMVITCCQSAFLQSWRMFFGKEKGWHSLWAGLLYLILNLWLCYSSTTISVWQAPSHLIRKSYDLWVSSLQTAEAQVAVGKPQLWVSSDLSLVQVQSALPTPASVVVEQTAAGRLKANQLAAVGILVYAVKSRGTPGMTAKRAS